MYRLPSSRAGIMGAPLYGSWPAPPKQTQISAGVFLQYWIQ